MFHHQALSDLGCHLHSEAKPPLASPPDLLCHQAGVAIQPKGHLMKVSVVGLKA